MKKVYCSKCKITKGYFIKYAKGKTGIQYYYCVDCNTNRAKKYRETSNGRKRINKAIKKSLEKFSFKQQARAIVREAIKNNKIKKPLLCSNCNKHKKLEGHHPDYSKPLKVLWLCKRCHCDIHHK